MYSISSFLFSAPYIAQATPICRRFDRQLTDFEALRALLSAGKSIEIKSAMIPITTSSSTSVKPLRRPLLINRLDIRNLHYA